MISKEKPVGFKKEIEVVACYIQYDNKFVLLHRHDHKSSGNKFGLPAGKVDIGETIHQAMRREIYEETGLEIPENKLEYFDSLYVQNEGHDIYYHTFFITFDKKPEIKISSSEHKDFI